MTHVAGGPPLQETENNNYFSEWIYYLGGFSLSALQSESQKLTLINVREAQNVSQQCVCKPIVQDTEKGHNACLQNESK